MSSNRPLSQELQDLEELISEAQDYVVPSEELRPELLEVARQHAKLWKIARAGALTAAGLVLIWGIVVPAVGSLSKYRDQVTAPSSSEVEQMAQDRYQYYNDDEDWSLVETFSEVRDLDSETDPGLEVPLKQLGEASLGIGTPTLKTVK
ncbi:MAG: hypothetical protein AAF483_08500 [Planctomycetota bacterium]